ncbi:MAG TPA: S-formylglutathione hydrolase [Pseudomonadales bacterium]
MPMHQVAEWKSFGGYQRRFTHRSESCGCDMTFAVYLPPAVEAGEPVPVLYWLSGLTCTDENFITKAGAQRYAAEHGLALVAPDTSPRGVRLPGEDDSYDFGSGAGFYVDATEAPWSRHYRMYSYVTEELRALVEREFPVDPQRTGLFGHSMGGHGALVLALRNPDRYRSVSAFAPIVAPSQVPWGIKAFTGYLGQDRAAWGRYDAVELIREHGCTMPILVDQGDADEFLEEQLKPHLLQQVCRDRGVDLRLRMQPGYDHSYYFIATFIGDHLAWHAAQLRT